MARVETLQSTSPDGTRLHLESRWPAGAPRAHVTLVHGFGDHIGRYAAFADHLAERGIAVHGFDYRGHGRSEGRRGYCARYTDLHDDLRVALERTASLAGDAPQLVFCHSHGGLLVTSYGLTHGLGAVRGVVYSAPWLRLAFQPPRLKLLGARLLRRIAPTLPLATEISFDSLSTDVAWQESTRMDPLYGRTLTPAWFFAALAEQERVLTHAADVRWPLVVHHGTDDRIASIDAARDFAARVSSKDRAFVAWEGYRHELVQETRRAQVWDAVGRWIDDRL